MWIKISARPSAACFSAAAAFCAFAFSISCAQASSERVKSACRADYFRHCSAHAVDSPSLRQCMRNVGEGLSNPCLAALALDGEITKEDVQRYQARAENGSKAASDQVAPKKAASVGKSSTGSKAVSANTGKTVNGGKAVTASKTAKVASTAKSTNGGKAVTASKKNKVASVGKSANGGKAVTASKTKVASTGTTAKATSVSKTANGGKAVTASKGTKVASTGKTANGSKTNSAGKTTANGGKAKQAVKSSGAVQAKAN
jgi:hypothetical protein